MTFHPSSMDDQALNILASNLQKAVCQTLEQTIDRNQAQEILAHALGYEASSSSKWSQALSHAQSASIQNTALSDPRVRKTLWRILATQMECGIPIYDVLEGIRTNHAKLGLSKDVAQVVYTWQDSMRVGGQNIGSILAKDVFPFDPDEGLMLSLGARLGSFSGILSKMTNDK